MESRPVKQASLLFDVSPRRGFETPSEAKST
jgi:hypothetical protein